MSPLQVIRPVLRGSQTLSRRGFSSSSTQALARMQLIGRLGATPEVQATSTGRDIVRYSIGTSSGPKDNRQTSWFHITSFDEGPRRDLLTGLAKGTLVYVEADSRMNAFDNAEGKKQYRLDLIQRSVDVLSRPLNRDQAEYMTGEDATAAASG